MPTGSEKIIKSEDGSDISTIAAGTPGKTAIVFIHGMAMSFAAWTHLFDNPALSSDFYLIAYDQRGHGRSSKPTTPADYESEKYAQDFAAVVKHYNAVKPIVVAWSLGGTVIPDILTHNGIDAISGIVYAGAIPFTKAQSVLNPYTVAMVPPQLQYTDVEQALIGRINWVNNCFNDHSTLPWATYSSLLGSAASMSPTIFALILERNQSTDALAAAGKNGLPILVLHGTKDRTIIGPEVERLVREWFIDVEAHYIEGGSHSVFWEHESVFVESVVKFSQRVSVKA